VNLNNEYVIIKISAHDKSSFG